jgi:hypothetical protein
MLSEEADWFSSRVTTGCDWLTGRRRLCGSGTGKHDASARLKFSNYIHTQIDWKRSRFCYCSGYSGNPICIGKYNAPKNSHAICASNSTKLKYKAGS